MNFHFRYHFPSKHYALIVAKKDNCFFYMSLTHTAKTAKQKNLILSDNPNGSHYEPAYLSNHIRKNPIGNFSKKKVNHLCLSREDEAMVTNFLEEKRRRKEQTHKDEEERER